MHYPARVSSELRHERCAPRCPHCGGLRMHEATVSLEELLSSTVPGFVPVEGDGYVHQVHALLVVECPDCQRPSVLAVDDMQVKLIAARTEKDDAYASAMGWQ